MLDEIFNTTAHSTLSFGSAAITLFVAFALGLIISLTYIKTHSKGLYDQNFTLTLIMLPCIIAIIILLIGSNVARAFGLAGAFSIIRFRSTAGDHKDIAYVLFTMAAGLACGAGVYQYAIFLTIILCIFMIILCKINFGARKTSERLLKIIIPENLDYKGAFDDIFDKYTEYHELKKVKTTDLGTLFELMFVVSMKDTINEKEFLDALRCRNGNLNIILAMNADSIEK